jgi:hypothetical protein
MSMRLFAGLGHSDYQDVLRAIGFLCDQNDWSNLRLIECEEGLILQYKEYPQGRDFTTYLYSDEDLQTLLREAYHRRNPPQNPFHPNSAPAKR